MTVKQWIRTPKSYVIISMVAYLLIASIWLQDIKGLENGMIAVLTSVAVDIIWCRMEKRKRILPDGAIVTGLIISLILSTTSSWYIVAAAATIAIITKHILVYKRKPIFNPAAAGLFLSILFFQTGQSWWGAFGDLPAWSLVFILIGGYIIINRVNKFPLVFSFLATYFILLFIMGILHTGDASDALRMPFINAILFFAFFMLTDPPTSPAKMKDQVMTGILTAIIGSIVYGFSGGLMFLFIGLLTGNLYNVLKARSSMHPSKKNKKVASA